MDIIFEGNNRNPNPSRVFTRVLYSIYRQEFIENRGAPGGGRLISCDKIMAQTINVSYVKHRE